MHFDQFENEEAHEVLTSQESFDKFDSELWASQLEIEPTLDSLTLIRLTEEFFGLM